MPPPPGMSWIERVPDALAVLSATGEVVASNAAFAVLAGDALIATPIGDLLSEVAPCGTWRARALRTNGVPITVDVSARTGDDGTQLLTLREVHAVEDPAGRGALLDVAFDNAPIGMAFCNSDGEYTRVNVAFCTLLDRAADDLLGRRDQEFTHPEHRDAEVDAAWRILRGEIDSFQGEKRFIRPDGSAVWVIANMTFVRDAEGRPLAWLGQFQDITERRALEDSLRTLADHDPLTGLPNRRRLESDVQSALSSAVRHNRRGALLLLDLDGFKAVNDLNGHVRGDTVLTDVARRLRTRVRESDLLARLGGDEFAVLLDGTSIAEAERVAEDLRACVADVPLPQGNGRLSVSIGIATFDGDTLDTPAGLVDRADRAMYRAKPR